MNTNSNSIELALLEPVPLTPYMFRNMTREERREYRIQLTRYRKLKGIPYARSDQSVSEDRLRQQVLDAYGNKCACCEDAHKEFLHIDHVFGDGAEERKLIGTGVPFYKHLKELGFPKDRYRLLCANCNLARGRLGYCPHEREVSIASK
jgi:hypothetical protein